MMAEGTVGAPTCLFCYVTLVCFLVCKFQRDRGATSSSKATDAGNLRDGNRSSLARRMIGRLRLVGSIWEKSLPRGQWSS
jgi:hypothetical protein